MASYLSGRAKRWLSLFFALLIMPMTQPSSDLSKASAQGKSEGESVATTYQTFTEAYNKGVDLYKSEAWEPAVKAFEQAKRLNPAHAPTCRMLAMCYAELHRFSDAEREMQNALQLDPQNLEIPTSLAAIHLQQGNFDQAHATLQQVVGTGTESPRVQLLLGIACEGMNDFHSAGIHYERVLSLAPGSKEARQAQARLQRTAKLTKSDEAYALGNVGVNKAHGWWNLRKMPLHVYVDNGDGTLGYRPEMRSMVYKALDAWSWASGGRLSFVVDGFNVEREARWKALNIESRIESGNEELLAKTEDPIGADIHIHWSNGLKGNAMGVTYALRHRIGVPYLVKAHIFIRTDRLTPDKKLADYKSGPGLNALLEAQDRLLSFVTLHEMGHALGLDHSANPNDLMYSCAYGANAADIHRDSALTDRDVTALSKHYNGFQGSGVPPVVISQAYQQGMVPPPPPTLPADPYLGAPPFTRTSNGDSATSSTGQDASSSGSSSDSSSVPPASEGTTGDTTGGDAAAGGSGEPEQEGEAKKEEAEASLLSKTRDQPVAYDPIKSAMFELNQKNYDKSLSILHKVLSTNPRNPQALYMKAVVLVHKRDYASAARSYKDVLKLVPNSELGRRASEGLRKINWGP